MFVLQSKIEIGEFVFYNVHHIEITKSVDLVSDFAVIQMPTSFKVRQNNTSLFVEEAIKVGDTVSITLAYKGVFEKVEFSGFVKKINPSYPLEIHCEDATWHLKQKNIKKNWNSGVSLKEILNEVVLDTDIVLSDNVPDLQFDRFKINNANGAQVLQSLKKDNGLFSYLDDDGKLYCGLEQGVNIGETVSYNLNKHLVENQLKFKTSDERKLRVRYVYVSPDNQRTIVEVGDADGSLRTFHTSNVSDKNLLEQMATAQLQKVKFEGFEGSITTFLIPEVKRGMTAVLIDNKHENRSGNYFVKKVKTTFGLGGARRETTLGNRL